LYLCCIVLRICILYSLKRIEHFVQIFCMYARTIKISLIRIEMKKTKRGVRSYHRKSPLSWGKSDRHMNEALSCLRKGKDPNSRARLLFRLAQHKNKPVVLPKRTPNSICPLSARGLWGIFPIKFFKRLDFRVVTPTGPLGLVSLVSSHLIPCAFSLPYFSLPALSRRLLLL
jgi:hypothetical protein